MKITTNFTLRALPVLLVSALGASAFAQDATLMVKHLAVSVGADGIKRTIEYAERMVRSNNQVWVERIVPPDSHNEEEHKGASKAHKHLDVAVAPRWVVRKPDGTLVVHLAARSEQALVNIAKVDYDNIGFDGSWITAYHLIDPASLKRMKVTSTQGNLTSYASNDANRSIKVVWNDKLKLPVSVETRNGTSSKRTLVEVLAQAKTSPWESVKKYNSKEYSDYLD